MKYIVLPYKVGLLLSSDKIIEEMLGLHRSVDLAKGWISLAFNDCKNIGAFQFEYGDKELIAWGTYVLPSCRRKNIARQMWANALELFSPKKIDVFTISKSGRKLINSLSKKYNQYNWNHI
jgi:ribosomal protein S18 acetylase RimI-like enzyme